VNTASVQAEKKVTPMASSKVGPEAMVQLEAIEPPADLIDPQLTPNALKVLERRYLKKDTENGSVIETPRQLFWRVAAHIAKGELCFGGGTPEKAVAVAREFYDLMAKRFFMPNSPTLMNAGREMGMLSACFVLPVEDSIEGIFDSIKATALIQKAGGGTGFSFSRLRPQGDIVKSSGGTTEGPLSFIQVFSKATDAIQQGAFRRGANMGILRIDHPDIMSFITFKDDLEPPAELQHLGLGHDPLPERAPRGSGDDPPGDEPAHEAVEALEARRAGQRHHGRVLDGRRALEPDRRARVAHRRAGVVFIDRINEKNPIKNVGLIEATNPCGEQPLHPYDSCNLGSINLGVAREGRGQGRALRLGRVQAIIHTTTRFLDNVIEVNKYPLPEIDAMSKTTRRIGLGVMGFADALYKLGIAYNSEEGCAFGEKIMQVLNDESHLASEILAEERGVFPAWEGSDWQKLGRRCATATRRPSRRPARSRSSPTARAASSRCSASRSSAR
jgi:ribonucleoside-diphosphate reductase alpha chain